MGLLPEVQPLSRPRDPDVWDFLKGYQEDLKNLISYKI